MRAMAEGQDGLHCLHERAQGPALDAGVQVWHQGGKKTEQVRSLLLGELPRLACLGRLHGLRLCHARNSGILF
jgi:hypothetical protein